MFGPDSSFSWSSAIGTVLALAGVAFIVAAIVLCLALVVLAVWMRRRVVQSRCAAAGWLNCRR